MAALPENPLTYTYPYTTTHHESATWPYLNQHTHAQPDNIAAFPTWSRTYRQQLDFHCFIDNDGSELVKELAVTDVTAFASRHWIFTHPVNTIVSNHKHVRTNRWLTDHYHGLTWTDGETHRCLLYTSAKER